MCDAKSAMRTATGGFPALASESGTMSRFIAAYIAAPKSTPITHHGTRLNGGSRAIRKKSATAKIMMMKCEAMPASGAHEAVVARHGIHRCAVPARKRHRKEKVQGSGDHRRRENPPGGKVGSQHDVAVGIGACPASQIGA